MEIGCSVADALVGGWCVGELGYVMVYIFAQWSGCCVGVEVCEGHSVCDGFTNSVRHLRSSSDSAHLQRVYPNSTKLLTEFVPSNGANIHLHGN